MPTLDGCFNDTADPRTGNAPRHKFCDLMTIGLLCALCGGDTAVDMECFGRMKEDFLRDFLELPHGIPCHDAYSRLFRLMNPASFQAFFDEFRADFAAERVENAAIAVDGKQMRRSFDKKEFWGAGSLNFLLDGAMKVHLAMGIFLCCLREEMR